MTDEIAQELLALAEKQGFALAGFTDLELSQVDRDRLNQYVAEERYGEMQWFRNHQDLRLSPQRLLSYSKQDDAGQPIARSAMVLAMLYRDSDYEKAVTKSKYKIARYAVGRDYHKVIKKRATVILHRLAELNITARLCVDSAPVAEKLLARKAGIGWQGKNSLMIHPDMGSFFLLGVILLDCNPPEEPASEITDHCRSCNLCVAACPTGALEPYRIDPRRCLSYLTIEAKDDSSLFQEERSDRVFGCDICQEVCPYNRSPKGRAALRTEEEFAPWPLIYSMLEEMPADDLWQKTAGMALRRIDLEKMKLNYEFADKAKQTRQAAQNKLSES